MNASRLNNYGYHLFTHNIPDDLAQKMDGPDVMTTAGFATRLSVSITILPIGVKTLSGQVLNSS